MPDDGLPAAEGVLLDPADVLPEADGVLLDPGDVLPAAEGVLLDHGELLPVADGVLLDPGHALHALKECMDEALEDEDEGFEDGTPEDEVVAAPAVADKGLPPMAAQEMELEAPGAAPTTVMRASPPEAAPEEPQSEDGALEDKGEIRGGGFPRMCAPPS